MDIFESLENLNVSEECFDEIMDMVEGLLSESLKQEISKKAGNGDDIKNYIYWNVDKYKKAHKAEYDELEQAAKREGKPFIDIWNKRHSNKQSKGYVKTKELQNTPEKELKRKIARDAMWKGYDFGSKVGAKEKVNAPEPYEHSRIARKEQEKKNK